MVAWTDVWTDPTLVFDETGQLVHTNKAAIRVFSDSERNAAAGVYPQLVANPSFQPFSWVPPSQNATYTVHPGRVEGHYFAVFKDARAPGELVAALNYNKLLYSGLANGTIEGLALVGAEKILDSNPVMCRIIGVNNAAELAGVKLMDLLGERNWKRLATRLGDVIEFEFTNVLGYHLVVEGRMTEVGTDGERYALALLDITEKRKISKDLLQTKERFRLLVETNPFGLFLVVQGEVRYANQAGLEILGIEDEEDVFAGKKFQEGN